MDRASAKYINENKPFRSKTKEQVLRHLILLHSTCIQDGPFSWIVPIIPTGVIWNTIWPAGNEVWTTCDVKPAWVLQFFWWWIWSLFDITRVLLLLDLIFGFVNSNYWLTCPSLTRCCSVTEMTVDKDLTMWSLSYVYRSVERPHSVLACITISRLLIFKVEDSTKLRTTNGTAWNVNIS